MVPTAASAQSDETLMLRLRDDDSDAFALRSFMRQLPDTQAEVITLAFFGGLTHKEIACQLALPEGTVKGRMRLGMHKLRSDMEERS